MRRFSGSIVFLVIMLLLDFYVFMAIRQVSIYLQRLAPRYTTLSGADTKGSYSSITPTGMGISEDRARLMIGAVEVEDEERDMIYRLMFEQTVRKLRQTVHSLRVIQGKRKKELTTDTSSRDATAEDYHISSSLSHIQQVTHSLATMLQDLESSFLERD